MNRFLIGMLTFFVISSALVETAWSAEVQPSGVDFEFEDSMTSKPARFENLPQHEVLYPKAWSASNGTDTTDFEFEEKALDADQVVEKPYVYEIRVGKNAVYTIDINPTEEAINRSLGFEVPDVLKEKILAEGGTLPPAVRSLEAYQNMNQAEQTHFRRVRLTFLRGMARILHHAQWGVSAGILTKDTLSYTYRKILRREIAPKDQSLAERRHRFIQNVLTSMNHRLFYQAPLVANKNEFGIMGALGGIALSGVRDKGFGGIFEAGIAIGYNSTQKAFIFEFTITPEKYHHSIAAATVAGINFKGGAYLASIQKGKETATVRGSSFYPPMAPGFSSDSPSYAAFGASSGLGVPPPPIADFLTFSNTFEKYKILRISIPRFLVTGLPTIGVGDIGLLLAVTKGGVVGGYNFLTKRFQTWRTQRTCDGLFAF
jgi:hypothetical protein